MAVKLQMGIKVEGQENVSRAMRQASTAAQQAATQAEAANQKWESSNSKVSDSYTDMGTSTRAAREHLSKYAQTVQNAQRAILSGQAPAQKAFFDQIKTTDKLSGNIGKLTAEELAAQRQAANLTGAVSTSTTQVVKATGAVGNYVFAMKNLADAMRAVLTAQNARNAASVMDIASLGAQVKGYDKLAGHLRKASTSTRGFATDLETMKPFSVMLQEQGERARFYATSLRVAETSLKTAAVGAALFAASQTPIAAALAESIKNSEAFRAVLKTIEDSGIIEWAEKVGKRFEEFGERFGKQSLRAVKAWLAFAVPPEVIQSVQKFLNILQFVAGLKGFDKTAEGLRKVRDVLREVGEDQANAKPLGDHLNTWSGRVDILTRAFLGLKVAAAAAGIGFAGWALKDVGVDLFNLGRHTKTLVEEFVKSGQASSALKAMGETLKTAFQAGETPMKGVLNALRSIPALAQNAANSLLGVFKQNPSSIKFNVLPNSGPNPEALKGMQDAWKKLGIDAANVGPRVAEVFTKIQGSLAGLSVEGAASKLKGAFAATSGFAKILQKDLWSIKAVTSFHTGPAFIRLAENSGVLGAGLFGLGRLLQQTDSTLLRVSGTLMVMAGIMMSGLSVAIGVVVGYLGKLVAGLGQSMLSAMEKFEEKFQKAQSAAQTFAFTLAGFQRTMGPAVGTTAEWNDIITELSASTVIGTGELQRMAAEIIAVGNSLGVTKNQQQDMLRVMVDYVKTNEEAFDTSVAFAQALGGNSQSVIKFGLHLSDTALAKTKLVKATGASVAAMSEEEKVQARLAAILEQSEPIRGKAAATIATIAGANMMLEKTINSLQQKLGSQGDFTMMLVNAKTALVRSLNNLPPAFLDVVGATQDFLGVTLTVIGTIMRYSIMLATVVTGFRLLSYAINASVFIQTTLSLVMGGLASMLNIQIAAVTSSSIAWSNLVIIMKAFTANAIASIGPAITGLATRFKVLTVAVMTNPLFWKAAGIAGLLFMVVEAFKRIDEETKIFSNSLQALKDVFSGTGDSASGLVEALKPIGEMFSSVLNIAISGTVVLLAGFMNGVNAVIRTTIVLLNLLPLWDSAQKKLNDAYQDTLRLNDTLTNVMAKGAAQMVSLTASTASASQSNVKFGQSAQEAAAKLSKLKKEISDLISANEKALIQARTMGNEGTVLLLTKKVAEEKLAVTKELDEKKNLYKEIFEVEESIKALARDSVAEASKGIDELRVKELERVESIRALREAAQLKERAALEPVQEKMKALLQLPASDENIAAIGKLSEQAVAIQRSQNAEVEKAVREHLQKVQTARLNAQSKVAETLGDDRLKAQLELQKQLEDFKKMQREKLIDLAQFKAAKAALEKRMGDEEVRKNLENRKRVADATNNPVAGQLGLQIELLDYRQLLERKAISQEEYNVVSAALSKNLADEQARIAAEASLRVAQAVGMEDDALRLTYAQQLNEFRQLYDRKLISVQDYTRIVENLETRLQDDVMKKVWSTQKSWAQAAGRTTEVIKLEAKEQVQAQQEALEKGLIDYQQFLQAKAEIARKTAIAESQTTGTASTDETINKATGFLEAARSGVASIISQVGSMFGPIGNLIAGIVNLLTIEPKQFKEMIQGLNKVAAELPYVFVENVPVLFQEVIRALPKLVENFFFQITTMIPTLILDVLSAIIESLPPILDKILSPDFVMTMVKRLATGLRDAFRNFWNVLFHGKQIKKTTENVVKNEVKFGPGADAGGSDFKVRDMNLAGDRAAKSVEAQVETTVDEGGKGFFQYIREAWDWVKVNIFEKVWDWISAPFIWVHENILAPIGTAIFSVFTNVVKPVFDGFVSGISWVWTNLIKPLAEGLWNGLKVVFEAGASMLSAVWDFAKSIFQGLWDGAKAAFTFIVELFKNPVQAFRNLFDSVGNIFRSVFDAASNVFRSIIDGFRSCFSWVGDMFSGAWDGLKSIFAAVFNPIIKLLNAIKIPALKIPKFEVSIKYIGSVKFWDEKTLWGGSDLIPGNIPLLAGGGLITSGMANPDLARLLAGGPTGVDTVPAILQPGEAVLPKRVVDGLRGRSSDGSGGAALHLTINVHPNANMTDQQIRRELVPKLIDEIQRESANGKRIISSRGVY